MDLSVEGWLAVITFSGSIIFGLMKIYHQFQRLNENLDQLNQALEQIDNHEIRIVRLEEQNKTLFKGLGGKKND